MTLDKPKNQNAEVLYELLNRPCIDRRNILLDTGILNPTARIAELRIQHGINIDCDYIKTRNKHKRTIRYGLWSIKPEDKAFAAEVYKNINH